MPGADAWPPLPFEEWRPTKDTLHRWCQIVGKVRMTLTPPLNHWWHVTLRVSARGVTTGPMPCAPGLVEIELDLVAHRAVVRTSEGATRDFALHDGLSVAAFHERLFAALAAVGVHCVIQPTPFDLPDATPFPDDEEHRSYDADAVGRWWAVLRSAADALGEFSGRFVGKTSPVQLFWHSLDLPLLGPSCAADRGRRPGDRRGLLTRGRELRLLGRRPPHPGAGLLLLHGARAADAHRAAARYGGRARPR